MAYEYDIDDDTFKTAGVKQSKPQSAILHV